MVPGSSGAPEYRGAVLTDLDLSTARDASLWGVVGLVVIALIAVWLVKQVVTKVLSVVVLLALAGLLWSQRVELNDCATEVRATIDSQFTGDTTCTFFGQTVTVPGLRREVPGLPVNTTVPG